MGILFFIVGCVFVSRLCSTARSTISGQGQSPELFNAQFDILQVLRWQGLFDHFWWQQWTLWAPSRQRLHIHACKSEGGVDLGSRFIGSGVEMFVCPSTLKIWTDMLAVSSNKGSRDMSNNSSNHNNINSNKTRRKEETITSRTLVPTTQQRSMHRFTTVCSSR